jgi:hypothetical protein
MTTTSTPRELPPGLDAWPPTQDDLPYEDGEMAESNIHLLNPVLLMQALQRFLAGVRDAFAVQTSSLCSARSKGRGRAGWYGRRTAGRRTS